MTRRLADALEELANQIPVDEREEGLMLDCAAALRAQDGVVVSRGWLLSRDKVNAPQAESIERLIKRAKGAHMIDVKVRINGHDEWFEADWIKHMIAAEKEAK